MCFFYVFTPLADGDFHQYNLNYEYIRRYNNVIIYNMSVACCVECVELPLYRNLISISH